MVFDYTGSAKQVRGGVNCPLSVTCNSTWFTVKAITDHTIPSIRDVIGRWRSSVPREPCSTALIRLRW